jgi:hypothetical protein
MLTTLTLRLSLPAAIALMTVAVGTGTVHSQEQQPVFRGRTETVAIYATALDRLEMVLNSTATISSSRTRDDGRT